MIVSIPPRAPVACWRSVTTIASWPPLPARISLPVWWEGDTIVAASAPDRRMQAIGLQCPTAVGLRCGYDGEGKAAAGGTRLERARGRDRAGCCGVRRR